MKKAECEKLCQELNIVQQRLNLIGYSEELYSVRPTKSNTWVVYRKNEPNVYHREQIVTLTNKLWSWLELANQVQDPDPVINFPEKSGEIIGKIRAALTQEEYEFFNTHMFR